MQNSQPHTPLVLVYHKPASKLSLIPGKRGHVSEADNVFQQSTLPLGNGDMGLAIHGEPHVERLVFNEKTLWEGGKTTDPRGDGFGNVLGKDQNGKTMADYFHQTRDLFLAGDNQAATKCFHQIVGDKTVYGSYVCFADLLLTFPHKRVKHYRRTLNLETAVATVSYQVNDTNFSRTYFVSHKDNAVVLHLTANGAERLSFSVCFAARHADAKTPLKNGVLSYGTLKSNGLQFAAALVANTDGTQTTTKDGTLQIANATTCTLTLFGATDYQQNPPVYRTGETENALKARVTQTAEDASKKGYDALLASHIADYGALFDKTRLSLGGTPPPFPTDKLLTRYRKGRLGEEHKRYLEELLFQFGRYLLLSSSRGDSKLPANLQGVWNNSLNPPWRADYHININLQMNYWPSFQTQMFETILPLVAFLEALRVPGGQTAKTYTATKAELENPHTNYGMVAHTECNPFGYTAPGEGEFILAQWSPAGVAWLLQNLYEGYLYTLDTAYLSRIYPIMKDAITYFDRTLVPHGGRLVSAPTFSPEHGPLTLGNTYEQSLIWQLYDITIAAAKVLLQDSERIPHWEATKNQLNPIEIGADGQIKEWYHETTLGSVPGRQHKHRHISHLLGLYPGTLINDTNQDYLAAARVSLKDRGNGATGWSMGHKLNAWARLKDGEDAYEILGNLCKNGTYKNLWDAHPPFQIDGNFGYTAGVGEMLLQSHTGVVELLPALPKAWQNGSVQGIAARGGFLCDFAWNHGKITALTVTSTVGGTLQLKVNGEQKTIPTQKGETLRLLP